MARRTIPCTALAIMTAVATASAGAQPAPIALRFVAADSRHQAFADAAGLFWQSDGARIVRIMELVSGLQFSDTAITVIIRASAGSSGAGGNAASPLHVDARYPLPMSLIHELGHRLTHRLLVTDGSAPRHSRLPADLNSGNPGLDGHKLLYLILYDVWERLYGTALADRWRATERGWADLGFGFIKEAWDWADALGRDGRMAKMKQIVTAGT